MIKVKNDNTYCSIPSNIFKADNLTAAELGLLCWLFSKQSKWDGELNSIHAFLNDTKEHIYNIFNSLILKGYIEQKNNDYIIKKNPKISNSKDIIEDLPFEENKPEKVDIKSNKPNLYTKCKDVILEYTQDEDIRNLLFSYLYLRLNPPMNSRFKDDLLNVNKFKAVIRSLDEIQGNKEIKLKSIQQSIDKQYFKFFNVHTHNKQQQTSRDHVQSDTISIEELKNIRNNMNEEMPF